MRHVFFAAAAAVTIGAALGPARGDDPPKLLAQGPLVGYAGHDAAVVWVAPEKSASKLELALAVEGNAAAKEETRAFPGVADGRISTTIRLDGLTAGTLYRYRVSVDGKTSPLTQGTFRTGPAPGKPFKGRVALVSCMNGVRFSSQPAWKRLLETQPDLIVHLGDGNYSNTTEVAVQREWWRKQRNVPEYAEALRRASVLAIWDDHDFGANDTDGTLPGKERSLETFKDHWPNPSFGLEDAPGVFFASSLGDVDLFFTDGRYPRSPNRALDGPSKQMLGEPQFAWLERGLRASRAPFKLIASGSTIDLNPRDSWSLYSKDRTRLLGLTRDVPGMVMLTGDIHNSMLAHPQGEKILGYRLPEIVSSGIAIHDRMSTFVTMEIDTTLADPRIALRVHRLGPKGDEISHVDHVIKASELGATY